MKRISSAEIDEAWDKVQGKTKPATKNPLLDEMAEDAKSPASALDEEKLAGLAKAVKKMLELEQAIEQTQQVLKDLTEGYIALERGVIPDIFEELGVKEFSFTDGLKISVKREFAANISEVNKPAAFKWLGKNGHDAIIKHDVIIKLQKGEKEAYEELTNDLNLLGVAYDDKEYVHPQTLKAFVKEQMEAGTDIPQDSFGIFPVRIAKIKTK